ncbi:LysE family translocator [Mesorhizobium sp. YIM 152430]|jgi:threonine/homoserine/homoserine lactone efflux protein|uniref:LysE family translocator n=1 Tax=Mesorhizobium sp. YIM 152430 TaxID=3031761 RepID=UPI0023DC7241|nr:LysE family translocator [Mesorhizobium sp. YIM 152430]MDF1600593.1 LysE family translocator [Mesorhizobium sp. YIM 152430]
MDFLPTTATLLQFAVATIVIAITPGPDMTLFVGRALSEGRSAGFACMIGAMTGIVIHTALVALGLSALIVASPQAFFVLKLVGALYLVWLAYQAIRHGSAFSPDMGEVRARRSFFANWATGLGINLLNPKIILFFMTFLPQFVSASDPDAPAKLFFLGALFIPLSLPITVPMVIAADRFSALLKRSPRVTRIIDYVFAGVFSAFALRILMTQAR